MARKKSKAQIWVEYTAARSVLGFFGILPRSLSIKLGMFLGSLGYSTLSGLRRAGLRSLEIAYPENSRAENEQILKASFRNLGRILGEVSQFPRATKETLKAGIEFDFESEETKNSPEFKAYNAERAKGRGIILAGPHLGNWEMGVFAYSALQEPLNYLARPLDNNKIEDLTHRLRTRFGNRPINKTNGVTAAMDILRDGGIVGVLPDVNMHPKEGIFVPFFGVEACTTPGVAMLALRTDAMIVPMCCYWDEEKKKYRVVYGDMVLPTKTGDRQQDVRNITAAMTLEMEKLIRRYPEQWLWIHKRWKTRPPGEESLY